MKKQASRRRVTKKERVKQTEQGKKETDEIDCIFGIQHLQSQFKRNNREDD
jgi:hypothetical protein